MGELLIILVIALILFAPLILSARKKTKGD